jgi:O-antigen/teichoic acid export membrane protein
LSTFKALPQLLREDLFLRQGAVLMGGLLLLAAGKAVAIWALANWLGPIVQGGFSLAVTGVSFGMLLFCFGLEYANPYLVGGDPERRSAVVANSLLVSLLILCVSPFWMWGFIKLFPQVAQGFEGIPWLVILVLSMGIGSMSLNQLLKGVAFGSQRFGMVAAANSIWGIAWAVGALLAVRHSYPMVLWVWLFSIVLSTAVYLFIFRPGNFIGDVNRSILEEQYSFGVRTVPGSFARMMNLRLGLFLVTLFLSPAEVGVYGVLLMIAEAFLYFPNALSQVILGKTAARVQAERDNKLAYGAVVALGMAAIALAFFFGDRFLESFFGSEYLSGTDALPIILGATTLHAIGLLRLHGLLGAGNPLAASAAQGIALLVTLVTCPLLIPKWGLSGAAFSMLSAYAAFAIYLLIRKENGT